MRDKLQIYERSETWVTDRFPYQLTVNVKDPDELSFVMEQLDKHNRQYIIVELKKRDKKTYAIFTEGKYIQTNSDLVKSYNKE